LQIEKPRKLVDISENFKFYFYYLYYKYLVTNIKLESLSPILTFFKVNQTTKKDGQRASKWIKRMTMWWLRCCKNCGPKNIKQLNQTTLGLSCSLSVSFKNIINRNLKTFVEHFRVLVKNFIETHIKSNEWELFFRGMLPLSLMTTIKVDSISLHTHFHLIWWTPFWRNCFCDDT
jgi:hypothetical protein